MENEYEFQHNRHSDIDIEELFLGNILREPRKLKGILSDVSLRPEAFSVPRTRAVYRQILQLTDEGIIPELEQVQSRLNGECPDKYAHVLADTSTAIDLEAYANRIFELWLWRKRKESVVKLNEAISQQDIEAYSKAKAVAEDELINQNSYYPPDRLAEEFRKYISAEGVEAFELPFKKLNDALGGGLRRRQFTVLGGWTSHGKSVVIDQILTYISRQGKSVHLYMNEMGHEERVARLVAADSGIRLKKIMRGQLDKDEKAQVEIALQQIPFSITPCAGWSVEELTFDIRSKDYDVIGVDIIHQFDYDSESELARISRLLTRAAKQANCHVIATVHLNEYRVKDVIKPRPVPRDIRGSGMLQRDPDNVLFIYRECDPYSGDPLTPSNLYASKVRNGSLGGQNLMFNYETLQFEKAYE